MEPTPLNGAQTEAPEQMLEGFDAAHAGPCPTGRVSPGFAEFF